MKKQFTQFKKFVQNQWINIFFGKYFEPLNADSVTIDCGANMGDVTAKLAETGALVYAFEPNPYAFEKLSNRFKGVENVICIQKGVWDKDETRKLYFHKDTAAGDEAFWAFGSSIFQEKNNVDDQRFEEVELVDLTRFIQELDKEVDFLKIDVEGAELKILQKFIKLELYKRVKQVFVEVHDSKIPGQKEELQEIKETIAAKQIEHIHLSWI